MTLNRAMSRWSCTVAAATLVIACGSANPAPQRPMVEPNAPGKPSAVTSNAMAPSDAAPSFSEPGAVADSSAVAAPSAVATPPQPTTQSPDDTALLVEVPSATTPSPRKEVPPTSKAAIRVVILGSSSVAAKNLDQPAYGGETNLLHAWTHRYARYLEKTRPGSVVVVLAKPGIDSWAALPTGTSVPSGRPAPDPTLNIDKALSYRPNAVILHYPSGRDFKDGIAVDMIVHNYEVIAAAAAQAGAQTWVMGPNPTTHAAPSEVRSKLQFHAALRAKFGSHYIDCWSPRSLPDGSPKPAFTLSDGIHPNAEGHRLTFEAVRDANIPQLVLKD